MPRPPKPYVFRDWYVTNYGGVDKQKLCKVDEGLKAATIALARLMVQRTDAQQEGTLGVSGAGKATAKPKRGRGESYGDGLAGPGEKTVAEVFDEFLDFKESETDPETYKHYCGKLAAFYERFGTRGIRSITLKDGLAYKKWLIETKPWKKGKKTEKGVGPTTVNHHIRAARTLFNWAKMSSRGYIDRNPWEEIRYLPEKGRERLITDEEFSHLLAQCTDGGGVIGSAQDFRERLIVLRHTTFRPGELRKLKWAYIRFEKHQIVFPPEVIKTKSRRAVTMLDTVEEVLKERKRRLEARRLKPKGYVFPGAGKDEQGKRVAAAGDQEKTIEANSFSQRFRRLCDRCVELGLIEEEKGGERLVLYSSRHTRITELVASNIPMKAVMDEAGHKVPATTNRYTHLADEYQTGIIRQHASKRLDGSSEGGG